LVLAGRFKCLILEEMLPIFPQFAPLTIDDRERYEALIHEFPPFSDISFATLHIWWNLEGQLKFSTINQNLLIDYSLPFDEKNSGYSIIGQHLLDESIQTIFEYLRSAQKPLRLVHVPEFVAKKLGQPENFTLEEEIDYNEYILDSRALASLEGSDHGKTRRKVNRFLREVEERKVEILPLDLSSPESREQLFQAIIAWENNQTSDNDPARTEHAALKQTLAHAASLGIEHLGLYIDDKLHAVILYHRSHDNKYFILNHLKVDYSIPYIFDYMTHHIANKAVENNIDFLNMEMDLGIENLRRHKTGLRPVDFFRKYTVTPAES
jgi:hypothetical protein